MPPFCLDMGSTKSKDITIQFNPSTVTFDEIEALMDELKAALYIKRGRASSFEPPSRPVAPPVPQPPPAPQPIAPPPAVEEPLFTKRKRVPAIPWARVEPDPLELFLSDLTWTPTMTTCG